VATKPKQSSTPVMSEVDPNRLYTYIEVAALCGATDRQVRRWVEDGKLAYTRLPAGRGRRVSGQQYLDYIAQNAVDATV
jgi:excisionase family DNA binding protein